MVDFLLLLLLVVHLGALGVYSIITVADILNEDYDTFWSRFILILISVLVALIYIGVVL